MVYFISNPKGDERTSLRGGTFVTGLTLDIFHLCETYCLPLSLMFILYLPL